MRRKIKTEGGKVERANAEEKVKQVKKGEEGRKGGRKEGKEAKEDTIEIPKTKGKKGNAWAESLKSINNWGPSCYIGSLSRLLRLKMGKRKNSIDGTKREAERELTNLIQYIEGEATFTADKLKGRIKRIMGSIGYG